MIMKTTLNKIREQHPCSEGWEKLLKHLGKTKADDEPLPLLTILESNGLDDALWCLRAVDYFDREIRLFAIACARDVQHLMRDDRSIAALDVAERYANGKATENELKDAASDALDAAEAADAARVAAMEAAWDAAWVAAYAARRAARDAARYAAGSAANAAWVAASDAAADAANAAMSDIKAKQEQRFREMILKFENTGA
jgi:hypothetical protein